MCKDSLKLKVHEHGSTYGLGIYSDAELLSIITGLPPENFDKNLHDMFFDPCSINGIGEKKKMVLLSVKELALRLIRRADANIKVIHGPEDAAHALIPFFRLQTKENFVVMSLNTKNHVIAIETVSVGSLTASIVHPREVFEIAVRNHAASLIISHNHPSFVVNPSTEDIAVTQRLVKAGKLMDIPVLDHIIIGNENFVSLKEKGLL